MLPATVVNAHIRRRTVRNIAKYRGAPPEAIERRLAELEREWDVARAIEANAASIALAGMALGAFVHRRWLLLPAAACGFLLQHALKGWCPPVRVLRRLGFRTRGEIDAERRVLRGMKASSF